MRVGGVILCGGASSRMGTCKAWLKYGDEYGLQRVARICAAAVKPICVVAAADQPLPPLPTTARVIRDSAPHEGPVRGLVDGMAALEKECDAVFACSVDMPLLRSDVIQRIVALLGEFAAAAPFVNEHWQPLAAVYSIKEILPRARALLLTPHSSLRALLEQCRTRRILPEELATVDPDMKSLKNVNTPEDFASLNSDLSR